MAKQTKEKGFETASMICSGFGIDKFASLVVFDNIT